MVCRGEALGRGAALSISSSASAAGPRGRGGAFRWSLKKSGLWSRRVRAGVSVCVWEWVFPCACERQCVLWP